MSGSTARASPLRVIEVLDVEPEIRSNSEARCDVRVTRGEVEFRDVTFRYPGAGGDPVFGGISFRLRPGETLGVLGGTGSGKSMLVHLIPRLYDVTGGQVLVDGVGVRDYVLENLRAGIGMVLQDTVLFSGTIADNLRWGAPDASREDMEKAASEAQAAELALADPFIRRMPEGYDSMLTADGGNLSQGQRQLICIARAVLADPAILILDEATSSVDTRTELQIQKAVLQLMRGRTSFVIAHRLSTIQGADQILVIDRGRIVERGSHGELLAKDGAYAGLYESQFHAARQPAMGSGILDIVN